MNDNPNPNYRPDVVCLQKVISLEEIQKANEIIVNKQQDYLDLEDSPAPNAKKTSTIKFIRYEEMIEKAAWAKYRRLNGVKGFNSFQSKLKKYRIKNSKIKHNKIGCIILNFVEFWPENEYVDLKEYGLELPNQVVKFKKFYLDDALSKLGFVVGNKI